MEKMVGGILLTEEMKVISQNVNVSWEWYDEKQGTVKWTFKNNFTTVKSFLLYRNSYYFGNAFWPVYLNNPQFNEKFAVAAVPLVDRGAANNSAPLCIAEFKDGKEIVCFLFTLSPGQKWSMLEGGFSVTFPPSSYSASLVKVNPASEFCIKYDPTQVTDWDQQTGTTYAGYSPNPSTFQSIMVQAETKYVSLFADVINKGKC